MDFSLELCVQCGQVFRWTKTAGEKWVGVDGDLWFEVSEPTLGELMIVSNGERDEFERLFRFDWNGQDVRAKMAQLGPELAPYIDQLPGLRMMRPSSPVETFFSFLCTPNNHLSRISGMIRTLGEMGLPFAGNPGLKRFPTLETIASIPESELRSRGFGYRAATIPKAARAILAKGGLPFLDALRSEPYETIHLELCHIPGVGPKLADCIALYGLDRTEAVPIDTHIWQAATRLYFPKWEGSGLTGTKYREVGLFLRTRFGELAGWAHQYLFYDNVLNWRARRTVSNAKSG